MKTISKLFALGSVIIFSLGASPAIAKGWNPNLEEKAQHTIEAFKEKHAKFEAYFEESYAYVVFPSVGKGGIVLGAAHGKGIVFEKGQSIGKAKVTQITIGLQWGGQAYHEVIFFENEKALDSFKKGIMELSGQAAAVAITAGASADLNYENGLAVFTQATGGFMYDASLGGQKFKFYPHEDMARNDKTE